MRYGNAAFGGGVSKVGGGGVKTATAVALIPTGNRRVLIKSKQLWFRHQNFVLT
jgi:hypothetical protein